MKPYVIPTFNWPMSVPTFGEEEIQEAIQSLRAKEVTMGKKCALFEKQFAEYTGSKHAVMVNSGSTANLLMISALEEKGEIIVPALTWSTGVSPVIQTGNKPVFVDCKPDTLCIDPAKIRPTKDTRAIFISHILGNGCDIPAIRKICKKHDLILLEDTCESLGTKYINKKMGTFGLMGSYSFFFSHHISTIEGGMIVTDDDMMADRLRSMRAHGWTRDMHDREIEYQYDIDPRFMFNTLGYSVRPTEIQGAFGIHQLRKLDRQNKLRRKIASTMMEVLNRKEFQWTTNEKDVIHTWFGMPIMVRSREERDGLIKHLNFNGIDTRPIVAGNLTRHPAFMAYREDYQHADKAMDTGFYIGIHPEVTDQHIHYLKTLVDGFYA